jgi:hypothetical protein
MTNKWKITQTHTSACHNILNQNVDAFQMHILLNFCVICWNFEIRLSLLKHWQYYYYCILFIPLWEKFKIKNMKHAGMLLGVYYSMLYNGSCLVWLLIILSFSLCDKIDRDCSAVFQKNIQKVWFLLSFIYYNSDSKRLH